MVAKEKQYTVTFTYEVSVFARNPQHAIQLATIEVDEGIPDDVRDNLVATTVVEHPAVEGPEVAR